MEASELTLLVAFAAGLISFLSPCVLPLVPAYIGQLTVVAVVGKANAAPSRWLAVRHAFAYVLGFGAVFTILGITATFVGGPLGDYLPALRTIGGILLIVMGLNLAGILRIPALDRTWRPLEAGAAGALAQQTGTVAFATPGDGCRAGRRRAAGRAARRRSRRHPRVVRARGRLRHRLDAVHRDHPRRHPDGRRVLGRPRCRAASCWLPTRSASGSRSSSSGVVYDRAPALVRPLVRHGRAVSLVGGLLVAADRRLHAVRLAHLVLPPGARDLTRL